jgi:hypothetical protein
MNGNDVTCNTSCKLKGASWLESGAVGNHIRRALARLNRVQAGIRSHHWNQTVIGGIGTKSAQQKVNVMRIGYARPFSFQIGRRPETKVSSVRHGVTEITLSDGRLVRATLHVKSVKVDPTKPGAIDVSYNVIAEVMAAPDTPICDVHETIQWIVSRSEMAPSSLTTVFSPAAICRDAGRRVQGDHGPARFDFLLCDGVASQEVPLFGIDLQIAPWRKVQRP